MAKFRVRARTVDMLGRQQIAGIPTAIHELFKNAYDAYANFVEVDYYRAERLFLLRDDGFGMSPSDFEDRWLTLGTDSKLGTRGAEKPPFDGIIPKNKRRSVLGEKGIGRLAIAAIGPQVLVLTRPKLKRGSGPLTMSLINWGLFELPGIDVDRIEIPVHVSDEAELPTADDIQKFLIAPVQKNLKSVEKESDPSILKRIKRQLESFDVDPLQLDAALGQPSLSGKQHGTHFYIMPADKIIEHDIDGDADSDEATPLQKSLLGFSNTMVEGAKKIPISTEFRDWEDDANFTPRISPNEFLTPQDFGRADHRISGKFDECGNFHGSVSIYGEKPKVYNLPSKTEAKTKTACGPVEVDFAVVQGQRKNSKLPPEEWSLITKKLNKIGGLYVYKDGIRVLPYGDTDNDFLEIEKRRTKGASYYYFSHRRMFGAISINSEENKTLVEKAGREGFVKNAAFRDFRQILMDFLISLANDFFRESGEYSDTYLRHYREQERQDKIRTKQAEVRRKAQAKLREELEEFFAGVNRLDHEDFAESLRRRFIDALARAGQASADKLEWAVDKVERDFLSELSEEREKSHIYKPAGIGLTKSLRLEYAAYEEELERIEKEIFSSLKKWISSEAAKTLKSQKALKRTDQDRAKTIDSVIDKQNEELDKTLEAAAKKLEETSRRVEGLIKEIRASSSAEIKKIAAKEKSKSKSAGSRQADIQEISSSIAPILKRVNDQSESLKASLEMIGQAADPEGFSVIESKQALEEQVEDLLEEIDDNIELIQMGRAIGIVHHEFLSTIKSVRQGIERLEPWAEQHPELFDLYQHIHADFEHLHSYLTLFDPLSRRLNPKKVEIVGAEIAQFIENLFGETFKKNKVEFKATARFTSKTAVGYTSTFYPCFVNLIDNSIYWLKEYTDADHRQISLDGNKFGFVVSDNGPGIEPRYKNRIFDFGFSRKSNGRGMGLYICREALKREDFDLELLESTPNKKTAFLIKLVADGSID